MRATFAHDYPLEPRSVSKARHNVAQFASRSGLRPDEVSDVVLAVGEAVSNLVKYSGSVRNFSLRGETDNKRLVIWIEDLGEGFRLDPQLLKEPGVGNTGGLGLHLLNHFMDIVEFKTTPSGGSVVRLEKTKRKRAAF
jgi:anti-sigma regulatory factor (Ser/Thr protein kinase)